MCEKAGCVQRDRVDSQWIVNANVNIVGGGMGGIGGSVNHIGFDIPGSGGGGGFGNDATGGEATSVGGSGGLGSFVNLNSGTSTTSGGPGGNGESSNGGTGGLYAGGFGGGGGASGSFDGGNGSGGFGAGACCATDFFEIATGTATGSLDQISFYSDAGTTFLGYGGFESTRIVPVAVPEPSTIAMALAGLAAGGILRRRRKGAASPRVSSPL